MLKAGVGKVVEVRTGISQGCFQKRMDDGSPLGPVLSEVAPGTEPLTEIALAATRA